MVPEVKISNRGQQFQFGLGTTMCPVSDTQPAHSKYST